MIPGAWLDALAWAGAAAALGAAVVTLPATRAAGPDWSRLAMRLLACSAAAVLALFVFLASRFLATDLRYQYVFFYTGEGVAWPWRLAGTWAGREGSLLIWTLWLALITLAVAWWHRRRPALDEPESRGRAWTLVILTGILALFLCAVATQSAFTATSANLLEGRPRGNGINPTLKSGFILIHPPMMFAAYAMATVPLAASLGHLASGTDRWSRIAMPWARLGWLLMTFSLGLGALWAYYTLGFGGYWAWDPVEVANLLPWLAYTVYLHAQLHHARHGSYRAVGPFLAALPFLLTLFSTISTRSGLWVSVHAFTDPTDTFNPDAAGRFLDIMHAEPTLAFHVGLFLAAFATLLGLWCWRLARDHRRFSAYSRVVALLFAAFAAYSILAPRSAFSALLEASWRVALGSTGLGLLAITMGACLLTALPLFFASDQAPTRPARGLHRINLRSLAAYSVLVLGVALLVLFLFHVAASQRGSTATFYEERLPYLALPVTLGLIVFQGHQAIGRRRSLLLAGAALVVAGAAWGVARAFGEFRLAQGALLGIPALVLVGVGFTRIRRAGTPSGTPRSVRRADTLLLLAALLDLLFWLNPPTVRLGFWSGVAVWPGQAVFGALSILALWGAVRTLVGAPHRRAGALHLLVGALGGFYVAPVLAAASWLLRRRHREKARMDGRVQARLHQVALYGIHFAVALAILGYAPSTYLKTHQDLEFSQGVPVHAAGFAITFDGTRTDTAVGPADTLWQDFTVTRPWAPASHLAGELRWEENAGSHYPLPTTLRTWTGDLYLDVSAVHVAAGSTCLGPSHADGAWVEAYRAGSPSRVCAGDRIDAVRATVAVLPGLGLLWLALAVGVSSMALLLATSTDARRTAPAVATDG